MTMQGYIRGNTVVVEDSAINSYDGYKVEIHILEEKKSRKFYREQIEALAGKGMNICPEGMDAQDFVNSLRSEDRVF
ncbi:MAG: hypothetical protein II716_00900 [Treponema sp.]|nr:hypothetical protein [Treponema sp.]